MGKLVKKGDMQGPRIPAGLLQRNNTYGGQCLAGFGRSDPFAKPYGHYVGPFGRQCLPRQTLRQLGTEHTDAMLSWVCKWLSDYNPPTTPHNLTLENLKGDIGIEIGKCDDLNPSGNINYLYMCVLRWLYATPRTVYWVRYWVGKGMTHQQALVFGFIYAGNMHMWYTAFPLTKDMIEVFTPEGLMSFDHGRVTTSDGMRDGHNIIRRIYTKYVKGLDRDFVQANTGYKVIKDNPMTLGNMILNLTK